VSINFTPGCDFQAAGTAHNQIAADAGRADGLDQFVRIARQKMHRADRGVVSSSAPPQGRYIVYIRFPRGHARQARHALGVADDGRDGVVAAGKLSQNAGTRSAGGANQGNFHG